MFIAHLPAGYLISKALITRQQAQRKMTHRMMLCGLIGSVFPDIDMFYFYLINHHQHHHRFLTHIPLFWLAALSVTALLLKLADKITYIPLLAMFGLNVLAHLVLDTIVGDIWWLSPFVNRPFAMFTVPALYHPWWLNFILHWSFVLELVIIYVAYRQFKKCGS